MTHKDDIRAVLDSTSGGLCDACLVVATDLGSVQMAHQYAKQLAETKAVWRGRAVCSSCARVKAVTALKEQPAPPPFDATTKPWYWEGNVQERIVEWMRAQGYAIDSSADTASRQQGVDIIAREPNGREVWVSVKGYFDAGAPTPPPMKARHSFAAAVFDLILYHSERPEIILALGLPDGTATYATLAARIEPFRKRFPYTIFWVDEKGNVRADAPT